MSLTPRALVVSLALLAFACAALRLAAGAGSFCFQHNQADVLSQTAAYLASVENSSCYFPRELRTVVTLSGNQRPLLGGASALVFVATSATADAASMPSPMHLQVAWSGDTQLEIVYPTDAKVLSQIRSVNNLTVSFATFAARAP
jgi:hypothetical protein